MFWSFCFYFDLSTPAGKRLGQYQQQIDVLQEEIYKLESGEALR